MKKALVLLMCFLIVASCVLVGCEDPAANVSNGGNNGDASGSTNEKSEYVDENGKYQLVNMPKFNYSEKEFKIAIISEEAQGTYFNEEIDPNISVDTDQVIKDAVAERNNLVYENYGVTVKGVALKNVVEAINLDVKGDTGEYDAAMPFMCEAAKMAQRGDIYELTQYSNIMHLDAPWYDQMAIKEGSLAEKLYFVTGDISMMPKIVTFGITFNKDMLKQYYPDVDLYKKVEDHEWTYDYMVELSKGVTEEHDGETGMTYSDQWGLSSSNQDAISYYLASGEKLCSKDSNDLPILSLGSNARSNTIAMHVLETLSLTGQWDIRVEEMSVEKPWDMSLAIFAEGRSLFRTTAFSAIKKLRNYKNGCDFGILPMPLMDATQDDYYSPSNPSYANIICIPKSAKNPEFSAYMIEVMSCYGKNLLTPAYYETTLKTRDAKDPESEVMLDNYVFKNIVYDTGRIYSFGNVGTLLSTIMKNGSSAFVSTLDGERDAIIGEIDDYIRDIDK